MKVTGHFLGSSSPSHLVFPRKGQGDTFHLLRAGGEPHFALPLWVCGSSPVAASWHGADLGEGSPMTPWASPSMCKETELKRNGVTKDQAPSLAYSTLQKFTSSVESFLSLFWDTNHLDRVQPNFIIARQKLPLSCQKGHRVFWWCVTSLQWLMSSPQILLANYYWLLSSRALE